MKRIVACLAVLMGVPVFLGFPGFGLANRYEVIYASDGRSLPIGVFVWPAIWLVGIYLAFRKQIQITLEDGIIAAYVTWYCLVLLIAGVERGSLLIWAQAMGPIGAYILARSLGQRQGGILARAEFWRYWSGTVLAFLGLYVLQTIWEGGSETRFSIVTDHVGPFYNVKVKRFFPILCGLAGINIFAWVVFQRVTGWRRIIALGVVGFVGIYIAFTHSRTALIVVLLGYVIVSVLAWRLRVWGLKGSLGIGMMGVAVLLAGMFVESQIDPRVAGADRISVSFARLLRTSSEIVGRDELAGTDQGRLYIMGYALDAMTEGVAGTALGSSRSIERVNAESGILETGIRAGWPAFVMLVGLHFGCAWRIWRIYDRLTLQGRSRRISEMERHLIFAMSAGVSVLVGNWIINLATEPYSAPIFWYILGSLVSGAEPIAYSRLVGPGRVGDGRRTRNPVRLGSA